VDHLVKVSDELIERAILNDSTAGREIAASFVRAFGDFVSTTVRPILVDVAAAGDEPQLLVNGLAALLRSTADSIEFPLAHPRAGSPHLGGLDVGGHGGDGGDGGDRGDEPRQPGTDMME
jgi:hypothetical protein